MKHIFIKAAKIIIAVPIIIISIGYITMSLWNWLIPELFHGPVVTIWQTFGLIILSKILFSGFKGKGCRCCCNGNGRLSWKEKMRDKWDNLSSEERSKLKNKFFSKCYFKNTENDINSELK